MSQTPIRNLKVCMGERIPGSKFGMIAESSSISAGRDIVYFCYLKEKCEKQIPGLGGNIYCADSFPQEKKKEK